jgi:hypothetical protein
MWLASDRGIGLRVKNRMGTTREPAKMRDMGEFDRHSLVPVLSQRTQDLRGGKEA